MNPRNGPERCALGRDRLGLFLDGELPPAARAEIAEHAASCPDCARELYELQTFAARLADEALPAAAPSTDAVWTAISQQLAANARGGAAGRRNSRRSSAVRRWRSALGLAAAVVLALSALWLANRASLDGAADAQAAVDYGTLLNGVALDPGAAFGRFVRQYHGRATSPRALRFHAPRLRFAVPAELPGGFRLESAYALRIGDEPAAAASYRSGGEFLAAIFHRPVLPEDYGTHKDHPCVVGAHRGHRVQVGDWRLVHLTDATTCHCVLSRLDEQHELPAVLAALAPDFTESVEHEHEHSHDAGG
ncbi:MAG: zf-HC2 domain-containing protein [Phycisphaerae bacterium]